MGVDLECRFKAHHKLTQEELDNLSYNLLHRFRDILGPVHGQFSEPPVTLDEENSSKYRVRTWCRDYGKDYERGPALQIYGLFRFLLQNPLVKDLWMENDHGGSEKVSSQTLETFLQHWLQVGNLPYGRYFDKDKDGPFCCSKQMIRNGWGGDYKAWYCAACGQTAKQEGSTSIQFALGER